MGLFSSLKNFGSKIFNGIRKGVSFITNVGNKARNIISKGYNAIQQIPVIGGITKNLAETNIPLIGMSAKDLAGKASNYLDVANDVSNLIGNTEGNPVDQTYDVYKYIQGMKK
jgi:hypothetical protein